MGHANRPGQHHAVGLDSQPGCVCLSAGWSRQSNSNTDCLANGNTNCDGDGNSNIDTDSEADAHTEISADT